MSKNSGRYLLVVVLLAAAVVAFVLLKPGDKNDSNTVSTSATSNTTVSEATNTSPPKPDITTIKVKNGESVGGVKEVEVTKDDEVQILLNADSAEEVHVHGYDLKAEPEPGKPARIKFEADIEGVFEIELEKTGVQIGKLTVSP